MNTFNRKDVNVFELRNKAIYLMEAAGFQVVQREMPTILVSDEDKHPYYLLSNNTIVLTTKVANTNTDSLERTLIHELAHSCQPAVLLGFDINNYVDRLCERQAYYVQRMYEMEQSANKYYFGAGWRFMLRYGNRHWFKEEYRKTYEMMKTNPAINNHGDIGSTLGGVIGDVMGDNPFFKN